MLRNYLRISLRNLWKRRTHTLINVLGLSLGIASAMLIFLIVRYELSFDRFHKQVDRMYRVVAQFEAPNDELFGNAGVPRPLPEALREDFAEELTLVVPIEEYQGHKRVQVADRTLLLDETAAYTEPGYFRLFDFSLQEGDTATALTLPNEVVITPTLSQKLFGRSQDVLGEVITLNDTVTLKVSGVLEDLSERSDFRFGMLISYNTLPRNRPVDEEWDSFNSAFQTYVLLRPSAASAAVQSALTNYLDKYQEEDSDGWESILHLQPLLGIHFDGKYLGFPHRRVPRIILGGLVLLAVLLLLLACINFINLATAVSTRRSKEIGIRKVVGSSRSQIILYFLGEALFVTVLGTGLALAWTELGLLQLQQLYHHLQDAHLQADLPSLVFLIGLITVVTLLAGGYPAWILSRFRPVQMFKAHASAPQHHRISVRGSLVVFQFFVAQFFILSVLVTGQQLRYMLEAPLGFNQDAIITVSFPDRGSSAQQRIKETLQNHSGVQQSSLSRAPAISQSSYSTTFAYDGADLEASRKQTHLQHADADYFDTYQMSWRAGGPYAPSDSGSGLVVNEAFLREAGVASAEEVLGKYVALNDQELPIVGVIADYHAYTFGREIPPLVITNHRPGYGYLNLKVNMRQVATVLDQLKAVWQQSYPDFPFEYHFLDDAIAGFYQEYQRLYTLVQLFSGMAIFIGCLGLYGLVLFMVEQRTKEIGIRKVLGASVRQLLTLFSGQFVRLVLIAFGIAAPLAYFLMTQWLQSFVYRIEINGWVFAGCLAISLLLVMLTVGYQSVRAALANPVDALRDE